MLKKLILLYLITFPVLGQDLLVTLGKDSLNVKIVEETVAAIFYQQKNKNGKNIEQRIFKSLLKEFKYNYYNENGADNRLADEQRESLGGSDFKNFMKYRVGFDVGYWTASNHNKTDNSSYATYNQRLLNGGNFSFQGNYFLFENLGFGARYQRFGKSIRKNDVDFITPDGNAGNGNIRDNLVIHNLSPVITLRKAINYKNYLYLSVFGGRSFLKNQFSRNINETLKAKNNHLGLELSLDNLQGNPIIGYDSGISFSIHYLFQKFNNPTIKGYSDINNSFFVSPQNPFGITLGIKFYKFPKYLKLTSY